MHLVNMRKPNGPTVVKLDSFASAVVSAFDVRGSEQLSEAVKWLSNTYGLQSVVPVLPEVIKSIRQWHGRNTLLFWMTRYSRRSASVARVGVQVLEDAAYMVRMRGCEILAYSLRQDVVPHLERASNHKDQRNRRDAVAALDAIRNRNHHLFLDRRGSGIRWQVTPEDDPRYVSVPGDEYERLIEIATGLNRREDIIRKLGEPDAEFPDGIPSYVNAFGDHAILHSARRTLVYDRLSDPAVVYFVMPTSGSSICLVHPKLIGPDRGLR